eukprot:972649_1
MINNLTLGKEGTIIREPSGRRQTHKVQRPSEDDMRKYLKSGKGSISHGLVHQRVASCALAVNKSVLLSSGRNMTLSIGEMVGTLVVLRMTELPGKVWNKKGLVHDESPDIVEGLGRREGPMATFVGKNPMSSQNSSHPESISIPSSKPCESLHAENVGGDVSGKETIGGVDESSSHGSVASDEVHGVNIRFLKAFLRNCCLDFSLA